MALPEGERSTWDRLLISVKPDAQDPAHEDQEDTGRRRAHVWPEEGVG
jgi:hypothetical protein